MGPRTPDLADRVTDDRRYQAHAARADTLARYSAAPLSDYWSGYRRGMVRADREALSDEDRAVDAYTDRALRGDDTLTAEEVARWCGYHDGRHWSDVTAHRGLLRLAIVAVGGGSLRGFADGTWHVDEASVRQMAAGKRPIPATRHAELIDLIAAEVDRDGPVGPLYCGTCNREAHDHGAGCFDAFHAKGGTVA